jgi:hypothetical protein
MCNQESVGFSCVTASGEIRHHYRTSKFASIFTGEAMAVLKIPRRIILHIVTQRAIARQRLGKHIPAAKNTQAIIE